MGGPGARASASAASGRAQKFANNKSKMKMLDVADVRTLNQEHKQRDDKISMKEKLEQRKTGAEEEDNGSCRGKRTCGTSQAPKARGRRERRRRRSGGR